MRQTSFLIYLLLCFCCAAKEKEVIWWHKKAEIMVKNQLEKRGIQDERVLQAMRDTPRHLFISDNTDVQRIISAAARNAEGKNNLERAITLYWRAKLFDRVLHLVNLQLGQVIVPSSFGSPLTGLP